MQQHSYDHQVPKQGDEERNGLGIFMLWGGCPSGFWALNEFVHTHL